MENKSILLEKAKDSWYTFFIQNSKVAYLTAGVIFIWGISAFFTIPKESAPQIEYGIAAISTFYDGASATDIDKLVTQEIENKLKDLSSIHKITSRSSNNFSSITIEFETDTDLTKAMADVRNKIDEAKSKLPTDAEDPNIIEIDSTMQPIFNVNLVSDLHPALLRDYAEKLKNYLEQDSYVKEITINGGAEREIFIDVDPIKLQHYQVSLDEISSAIQRSHRDSPIGNFEINHLQYALRFQGQYKNAEEIKNIVLKIVTANGQKNALKLSDLANVYESNEKIETLQSFTNLESGQKTERMPTVMLNIQKSGNSNIFTVDPYIRKKVLDFVDKNFKNEVSIYFTNEQLEQTRDSYDTVTSSGISSIFIVFLLLMFFIGPKEALIASFVIPLSFLITIGATKSQGETLNFMVNFSLILSLGILVDTSIVIVEGIYEGIKEGFSPKEAAMLAVQEFKTPLLSGTLTTLAVFIPLLVLPGVMGKYLSFIPISVSITLIASLLVSLFLIPSIGSTLLKSQVERKQSEDCCWGRWLNRYYKFKENIIGKFQKQYSNFILKKLPNDRWRSFSIYSVVIFCILTFFLPVKFTMFPADDADMLSVSIKLPEGTVKEETLRAVLPVESILIKVPEIKQFESNISQNTGRISLELYKKDYRKQNQMRSSIIVAEDLREKFKIFQNYDVTVEEMQGGPPSEAPVAFKIVADGSEYLQAAQNTAIELEKILRSIPGTDNVKNDISNLPGEITFRVKREEALRLGVIPENIANLVRTAIKGNTVIKFTREGREINVTLRYPENSLKNFDDINSLQIFNHQGKSISLSQVVERVLQPAVSEIKRSNRKIAVTLSSQLNSEGNALEITNTFQEKIKDYTFPTGIEIEDTGENAANQDLFMALETGFVLAIFMIFTILVVQFNSFAYPFIIIFTIVMSFLGINIGLFITGTPRSLAMIIGTISLAGIVVNDAIILVDRINNLRALYPNKPLEEIISEAGASRLQPIILTTLTTAAGIAPLIWVDTFWAGLSYTIIFGLSVASFLTLFVTPSMYYQFTKHLHKIVYRMLLTLTLTLSLISLIGKNWIASLIGLIIAGIIYYFYQKDNQKEQQTLLTK